MGQGLEKLQFTRLETADDISMQFAFVQVHHMLIIMFTAAARRITSVHAQAQQLLEI